MNILALDMSLTAAGWAYLCGTGVSSGVLKPGKRRGTERLAWLRDQVLGLVEESQADVVLIEGYAYHARGRAITGLAELGGVVRLALEEAEIPWVEVPPTSLKKIATGKGNASKELVLVEAVKRLEYDGHDDNEADALWLLEAGRAWYGVSEIELPKKHLEGMDGVEWPEVAS